MAANERAMVEAAEKWMWVNCFAEPTTKIHTDGGRLLKHLTNFALEQSALAVAAERTRIGEELSEIHLIGTCPGLKNGGHCFMCDYIDKLRAERATDDSDPVGR